MYSSLRKDKKYFDLKIIVDAEDIFVHKGVICEKSEFISMLYTRKIEEIGKEWPPVSHLVINLPDNITIDNFKSAIDYLYDGKFKGDTYSCLVTLFYFMVSNETIMHFIEKFIYKKWDEDISKECIRYIIDNHNVSFPGMLKFFGVELGYSIPENVEAHGKDFVKTFQQPAIESKMFHFKDSKKSFSKFTFSGIDWIVKQVEVSSSFGPSDFIYKIYVHEDCASTEKIHIRATMFVYNLNGKVTKGTSKEKVDPQKFKVSYMVKNYAANKLCFDYFHKINRVSLLMEKID